MIDYEKVDKLVEKCKELYPDMPDYCLWVLACDYYIKEGKDEDDEDDEEIKNQGKELYEKAKSEFQITKYENIKVV